MTKISEFKVYRTEEIPDLIEPGVLYISQHYETSSHLCACGCGQKTVTRLGGNEYTLTENDGLVTLRPSIGNFAGEHPYHAHYYITNNKVEWLD